MTCALQIREKKESGKSRQRFWELAGSKMAQVQCYRYVMFAVTVAMLVNTARMAVWLVQCPSRALWQMLSGGTSFMQGEMQGAASWPGSVNGTPACTLHSEQTLHVFPQIWAFRTALAVKQCRTGIEPRAGMIILKELMRYVRIVSRAVCHKHRSQA